MDILVITIIYLNSFPALP